MTNVILEMQKHGKNIKQHEKPCSQSVRHEECLVHTAHSPSAEDGTCRSTYVAATKNTKRRSIHWCKKLHVAARQNFRCATTLKSSCPRWQLDNGVFGAEAFEVDHIMPYSSSGDNSVENLRALCPACHAIRSRLQRIATFDREDTSSVPLQERTKSEDDGRSTE